MNIDKKTLIGFGIGLIGGYLLCSLISGDKTKITLGADGKPQRMARRKNYKWNGQGKVLLHSKRNPMQWRDSYLNSGEIFSLTGSSDTYQGITYIETTASRMDADGMLANVWIQSGSQILVS